MCTLFYQVGQFFGEYFTELILERMFVLMIKKTSQFDYEDLLCDVASTKRLKLGLPLAQILGVDGANLCVACMGCTEMDSWKNSCQKSAQFLTSVG